ncbi:hypothetical protein [Conexibacter sp. DBS9H8]|uniref:hypothetical protein n=1 Tax=Conexibacter sp. DBS9H8 TaxID=2937801 RepID=UPI00200EEE0A|nr:hypothetical protein [Conexibacter sp. DBS9H8]
MDDRAPKLGLGEEIEVDGRRYEIVADADGGATLEPAITLSVGAIHRLAGGREATGVEVEAFFGAILADGEG